MLTQNSKCCKHWTKTKACNYFHCPLRRSNKSKNSGSAASPLHPLSNYFIRQHSSLEARYGVCLHALCSLYTDHSPLTPKSSAVTKRRHVISACQWHQIFTTPTLSSVTLAILQVYSITLHEKVPISVNFIGECHNGEVDKSIHFVIPCRLL